METRAANAFKLSLEGGRLVLEFGALARATDGPARVAVSDRVSLPLDIGRRLALQLDEALLPHAAALRADAAKTLAPAEAALAAQPGAASARPTAEEAGERAAQLLRMVGDLGVPYLYERSFRMAERSLMSNRFLLTLDTLDIPGDPQARVLAVAQRLGMPAAAREEAQAHFASAKCVHFGFEADGARVLAKLYLERAVPDAEAEEARRSGAPTLLHLAFKWDVAGGAAVVSRYWWRPHLSAAQIEERLAEIYRGAPTESLEIARGALKLAVGGAAAETLQFLEVEEAGSPRRSFDLNLYNAKLAVKDMQPLLNRMRERFEVRPGQWQALYDQIKTKTLGHLAGGVHRDGKDFFNVYYGVVGLPHFHGGFDKAAP